MTKTSRAGLLLCIAGSISFLLVMYSHLLLSPNQYMMSDTGDAVKNYYTFAHYLKHNHSTFNFEGMNYPYGESIFYTDGHPGPALLFKPLFELFPGLSNYSVGILNYFILLSFVFTCVLLYLIFRRLKIHYILAVCAALAIAILSPQTPRMSGHYGISYSMAIPLTIYLLMLLKDGSSKLRYLFLFINLTFWMFVHAYLGMMCILLVFLFGIWSFLFSNGKWKSKITFPSIVLLTIPVLAFLTFYFTVQITDIHTGRTESPSGMWNNYSHWHSIVIPIDKPFGPLAKKWVDMNEEKGEGRGYIGLSALLFGILYLILCFYKKSIYKIPSELKILLYSALGVLCLAMFIPFKWMEPNLPEFLNSLKQFRAIGRFSWVFYFVFIIIVVYGINQIIKNSDKKIGQFFGISMAVVFVILSIVEGLHVHKYLKGSYLQTANLFSPLVPEELKLYKIDTSSFQAIIPLPYFHNGSDHFLKLSDKKGHRLTEVLSHHLGLPIAAAYLTRLSIPESRNVIQLLSDNYYPKEIEKDLKNRKDFLLLVTSSELNRNEKELIQRSVQIQQNDDFTLYRLPYDSLFLDLRPSAQEKYVDVKNHGTFFQNCFVSDTSTFFYYNSFETELSTTAHFGMGAKTIDPSENQPLLTIDASKLDTTKTYLCRFWLKHFDKTTGKLTISGEVNFEYLSNGKVVNHSRKIQPRASLTLDGDWCLVEIPLKPSSTIGLYQLRYYLYAHHGPAIIDDLLFFEESNHIFHESTLDSISGFLYNSHFIRPITSIKESF
jgi:hypothetical protein